MADVLAEMALAALSAEETLVGKGTVTVLEWGRKEAVLRALKMVAIEGTEESVGLVGDFWRRWLIQREGGFRLSLEVVGESVAG